MPGFDNTFLNNVTRTKFLPAMRNQLYYKPVTMNRLMSRGRVKEMTGRGLEGSVVLVKHQSVGLFGGYDTLANQPVNPTVNWTLSPANYYATVAISGDEERQNSGRMEKLLDMLKIQMDNAYATMKETMITDMFGSSTSRGNRNTIVGLAAIIATTNTYANINRSTAANAGWKANLDSTAHTIANLKDPTSTSYMPSIMRTSFANANNDIGVDLIVSSTAIWNIYQDIAGTMIRFMDTKAELGFNSVNFDGVEYVFDKYSTANYLWMLSTPTLTFYVYPGTDFSLKEPGWQIPVDQDARVAHILWSGQLVCDAPRENAVLTSVGAS